MIKISVKFFVCQRRKRCQICDKVIKRKDIEKLFKKYVFFYAKNNLKQNIWVLQKIEHGFWCITLYSYSHYILRVSKESPSSVLPKVDNLRRFLTEKKDLPKQKEPLSKLKDGENNSFEDFMHHFCRILVQVSFSNDSSTTHHFFQYENIRPKVISCIRIDSNLRTQLFYETLLVPLPKWLKDDYYSRNIQNQSTVEHNYECIFVNY